MENVGDIISLAAKELADPNMGHFLEPMLLSWASTGEREIARRTHCLRKETDDIVGNLVVDTIAQSYSALIPDVDVIGIFSVHCGSTQRVFDITSIPELDRDNSSWRGLSSGTPRKVAPGPDDTLCFTNAPDTTWIAAHELYIIYSCLPTEDLNDTDDIPQIHKKAWDYIKDYCVLCGKAEDKQFTAWDRRWVMWKEGLALITAEPKIIVKGAMGYLKPRGGVQLNPP